MRIILKKANSPNINNVVFSEECLKDLERQINEKDTFGEQR